MISPVIEERIKRSLARVPESQQQRVADLVENFVEKQLTPKKRETELHSEEARLQYERDQELIKVIQARAAAIRPPGAPGSIMREFAGTISPEDCKLMREAIEEAFERVDPNEW